LGNKTNTNKLNRIKIEQYIMIVTKMKNQMYDFDS